MNFCDSESLPGESRGVSLANKAQSGQTRLPQNQRSQTQCGSNPQHAPAEARSSRNTGATT
ncbi:hypothetical protein Taro_045065 [Colocasia esculenta]|uniref:Uncharacterized protein n=1 Tax=Colocasia esculenta TaxID=4460 RepID=A0A843X647_COLES|nr:hypothetical protein [Colocasia esculenta]